MAGNTLQVGSDNKIRVSTGSGLVVGGAADACCCTAACTCCLSALTSVTPTNGAWSANTRGSSICTRCALDPTYTNTQWTDLVGVTLPTLTKVTSSGTRCATSATPRQDIYEGTGTSVILPWTYLYNTDGVCGARVNCSTISQSVVVRFTETVIKVAGVCHRASTFRIIGAGLADANCGCPGYVTNFQGVTYPDVVTTNCDSSSVTFPSFTDASGTYPQIVVPLTP